MLSICRSIYSSTRFGMQMFTKRCLSNKKEIPLPVDLFSLSVIADYPSFQNKELLYSKTKAAVEGGASSVFFRDHENKPETIIKSIIRLRQMLQHTHVPIFINTPHLIEVAQAVKPYGAFLEENQPLENVRSILGSKFILGTSIKTKEEAIAVEKSDTFDFLSVKIAPSKKCQKNDHIFSRTDLKHICATSSLPILVVGGLTINDAAPLYEIIRQVDGLAMRSGLINEDDPLLIAQKIQAIRHNTRKA